MVGDPWFCTGDRGVVDEDGFVTVFGNSWAARKKEVDAKNMAAMAASSETVEDVTREVEVEPVFTRDAAVDLEVERLRAEEFQRGLQEKAEQEAKEAAERAAAFVRCRQEIDRRSGNRI